MVTGVIMEKVGNIEDAQFISDWLDGQKNYNGVRYSARENPPEGWAYLGEGSYRSAWRSPEGCVYKVEHQEGSYQSNGDEYYNIIEALKCDPIDGTRIPAASLYHLADVAPVIAMECIEGKTVDNAYHEVPYHISRAIREISYAYGLYDMHGDNVMIEDGTNLVVPVDFGG